ncbi:hypothetical protein ACFLV2_02110 [Chloroflexota bacterium]
MLHFEEGHDVQNKQDCKDKLLHHLPGYRKNNIDKAKFTPSRIDDAVIRGRTKDNPLCEKWPETTGTTVYRLVEILVS